MQIKKELPQFNAKRTLLIAAGIQEAKLYLAHKGVISQVASFRVPTPHYSDREGFSMRRGGGAAKMVMGSGGEYDDYKEKIHSEFINMLQKNLNVVMVAEKPTQIYLLAPSYVTHSIEALVPTPLAKNILRVTGNYVNAHPFELLQLVM